MMFGAVMHSQNRMAEMRLRLIRNVRYVRIAVEGMAAPRPRGNCPNTRTRAGLLRPARGITSEMGQWNNPRRKRVL